MTCPDCGASDQSPHFIDCLRKGEQLRDAGAAAAFDATHEQWKIDAADSMEKWAVSGMPFNADQVRADAGDPIGHPNAMGGLFASYVRRGLIEEIGRVKMSRAVAHARRTPLYVGVRQEERG